MNMSPVKKERAYKAIIRQIKDAIKSGKLKPGDKVPSERDIAEQLKVSRTVVREAFSVLESSGLIEIYQGNGIYLRKNETENLLSLIDETINGKGTEINILELLEVRQGIDVQAVYLASVRRTEDDLKNIEEAYKNLETAFKNGELAAEEDMNFHMSIVKASHNKMLVQVLELFYEEFLQGLRNFRHNELKIPKEEKISQKNTHFHIFQSVLEGDSKKATEAMSLHYEDVKSTYLKIIKPKLEKENEE